MTSPGRAVRRRIPHPGLSWSSTHWPGNQRVGGVKSTLAGADRSEAAEIAATEIAATAEVSATEVAAARVITARVVTTALATARVVTTGIATRISPAVGVSGVISGVIAAADSRHPGEQAGRDQVRADAPRAGDQRRLPPGFGVPAARHRPAGHHAARVVVLG